MARTARTAIMPSPPEELTELRRLRLTVPSIESKAAGKATEYQQLVIESRKRQLQLTLENVQRLEKTFDATVEAITARIAALPAEREGFAWTRAQIRLASDIRLTMDALKRDFDTLLEVASTELAQNAADRERQTAAIVNAGNDARLVADLSKTLTLSDGLQVTVQFGRLALTAVERAANRYYSDGLKLSDRLYRINTEMRQTIENTIVRGLAQQLSAAELAKQMRADLAAAGSSNPRYHAMRIARTEINTAHREAHILSVQNADGTLKDYTDGVRWNLSLSHPAPDICDLYAGYDSGGGPGVYMPDDVPSDHPSGLCFTTTVLKAFPDSGVGGMKPSIADVSAGQRRQFEEQFPAAAAG